MDYTYQDIAKMIDHSLLNPTLNVADLESGCQVGLAYDVGSICIMPYYLGRCAEILAGSAERSPDVPMRHGLACDHVTPS